MDTRSSEQGFISLFTVVFFMLLISVLTIGFLRIMTLEQRQALDNDLTSSALASAESGVEDAKRAILKYLSLPAGDSLRAELQTALNSTDCDALFKNTNISAALGIKDTGSINGQPNLNQFYTCLSVLMNSPDYISSGSANKSEFIPLRSSGAAFSQVRVSWHLVSSAVGTEGDGIPQNYAPDLTLPQVTGSNPLNNWSGRGYPAYMRVQVFGYPTGPAFNRADLADRSRAIVLAPNTQSNAAAAGENDPISLTAADPLPHQFDGTKTGMRGVKCKQSPPAVSIGIYACTATIELPTEAGLAPGAANQYYLRLTPLYGASHFRVELRDGASGGIVNFGEVQPIVDVTGRASDVFRRIQVRLRLDSLTDLPEFALESADTVCKNMQVADGSAGTYLPNNCP